MHTNITRQIVLDTETTGLNINNNLNNKHRIIEIGAVEIINRRLTKRYFHIYLNPNRMIDQEAFNIHGINNEFLLDKPVFSEIANEFFDFIYNAELIIHNASFDVSFINYEFKLLNLNIPEISTICKVTDSLQLARKIFPGKSNSLDALCNRYSINNSERTLHSALLDAKILAKIFLLMTSTQTSICFNVKTNNINQHQKIDNIINNKHHQIPKTKIIHANEQELILHRQLLTSLYKGNNKYLW